jgi:hypothetical protein
MIATQVSKHHYSYPILDKDTSFYHSHKENSDHYQHYSSQPSSSPRIKNQTLLQKEKKEPTFFKRILIVDDDPDITLHSK